ncbi:helix-turn-helix domain-containing protein [Anaerosporobacter sp.]|uniref:helix-turn-helix domain-containing protein n=1 Tax=Anaerosporobacter sp. TaxID=1872529 RepID=UPI00286F92A2|nr:helix-turn-helix transcriptional regulator [Anaerosporobacter sp.]
MKSVLGSRIHALRKEKGVTQEEVGKTIGVTAQAVSNWECGGTPDAELLPAIADYFGVSIDNLFGKTQEVQEDLGKSIIWELHHTEQEKRFEKAFYYCWCIQQGVFDMNPQVMIDTLQMKAIPISYEQKFTSLLSIEKGLSLMRLNENAHYFFLMPEPKDSKQKTLHKPEEYEALFSMLGKPNRMKTLMFLYGRKQLALSNNILAKHLSLLPNEAKEILEELSKHGFLHSYNTETEQGEQRFYNCCEYFGEMLSLVPFLYFASNLIDKPLLGFNNWDGEERPLL